MNLKLRYAYNPSKPWSFSHIHLREAEFDLLIRALESYQYKIGEQAREDKSNIREELDTILTVAQKIINAASEE